MKRFLAEGRVDSAPERVLTTVLFTDIVDSTSRASDLGDRRWRELLGAHHATVRAQIARYGGREVRGTGDGFFATFEGPARAIAAAHGAMAGVADLGLDLRAGVHTGEVEIVRAAGWRASPCTSGRESRPTLDPAKCSCRVSCATWQPAPESTSRIAVRTSSRAFPENGGCLRLD